MDVEITNRDQVRQILRASEGIPSQVSDAKEGDNGRLSPARTGHPLSAHLHSSDPFIQDRTKFLSMRDMEEALWLLLQTPMGKATLHALKVGERKTVTAELSTLFGFECWMPDAQGRPKTVRVMFGPNELRRAGLNRTTCVAVIEGRERAGRPHLQVHTFYPLVSTQQQQMLLQFIRSNPPR